MKRPKPSVVAKLPLPSPVAAGQRWLITAERAPWTQHEDLTLTVSEVYKLSEHELKSYDVTTAAALRGEEYAVMVGDDVAGVQLPVSLLEEIGRLV